MARVSQLIAEELDAEIGNLLQEQFQSIFEYFQKRFPSTYELEWKALLKWAMYHLSFGESNTTYGGLLQNVRYVPDGVQDSAPRRDPTETEAKRWKASPPTLSRLQTLGFLVTHVLIPYVWARWQRFLNEHEWFQAHVSREQGSRLSHNLFHCSDWKHYVWTISRWMEFASKVLICMDWMGFLMGGRYRTWIDRYILKMWIMPIHTRAIRQISFAFLTRELIWNTLTNVLAMVLPMFHFDRIYEMITRRREEERRKQTLAKLPSSACSQCLQPRAVMPSCCMPCGHLCCYYCIHRKQIQARQHQQRLTCGRCNALVNQISVVELKGFG